MKANRFAFVIHALVSVLLLIIPYASTDQIFTLLDPSSDLKYLLLCFALSAVLILTFYFNYLFLIPKYLLTKKYWHYFSFLGLTVATVLSVSGVLFIFLFPGLSLGTSAGTEPIIEKLIPVVITNAILLWFLAIVSSILWTIYNRLNACSPPFTLAASMHPPGLKHYQMLLLMRLSGY